MITWFQNRRAKLKRDLEELKNDVTATQILQSHEGVSNNNDDEGSIKSNDDPDTSRSGDENENDECQPSPAKIQRCSERTSESDENNSLHEDNSDVDMDDPHSPQST